MTNWIPIRLGLPELYTRVWVRFEKNNEYACAKLDRRGTADDLYWVLEPRGEETCAFDWFTHWAEIEASEQEARVCEMLLTTTGKSWGDLEKVVFDSLLEAKINARTAGVVLEKLEITQKLLRGLYFDNTSTLEAKTGPAESTETGDLEAGESVAPPKDRV